MNLCTVSLYPSFHRAHRHCSTIRVADVPADLEPLTDDTVAPIRSWIGARTGALLDGFGTGVRGWLLAILDGGLRKRPQSPTTLYVGGATRCAGRPNWPATLVCGHGKLGGRSGLVGVVEVAKAATALPGRGGRSGTWRDKAVRADSSTRRRSDGLDQVGGDPARVGDNPGPLRCVIKGQRVAPDVFCGAACGVRPGSSGRAERTAVRAPLLNAAPTRATGRPRTADRTVRRPHAPVLWLLSLPAPGSPGPAA